MRKSHNRLNKFIIQFCSSVSTATPFLLRNICSAFWIMQVYVNQMDDAHFVFPFVDSFVPGVKKRRSDRATKEAWENKKKITLFPLCTLNVSCVAQMIEYVFVCLWWYYGLFMLFAFHTIYYNVTWMWTIQKHKFHLNFFAIEMKIFKSS